MASEFTIKNFNTTIKGKKEGDKDVEYKIEYENKDGTDKIKVDNKKGTKEITAKSIKKVVGGTESEVTNKKITVSYVDGGWITHYGKIEKVDDKELEKPYEVSFSGMNSFRPTFWIGSVVLFVLVAGGI